MARIHAEVANFTLNSVTIEDELNSIDLEITRDIQEVTAFADVAHVMVGGKYGWREQLAGSADFVAAQGDATIFALVAAASVAQDYDPSGTSVGASAPHYTGSVFLESYSLHSGVNTPATYRAALRGTGALTRAVA